MEWVNASTRTPADDVMVLILCATRHGQFATLGYLNEGRWRDDCDCSIDAVVTHWMPLPEPSPQ